MVFDPACVDILNSHAKIAIAVSGGADSMALAHILRTTFPDKDIYTYTVDHGLRMGSDAEAMHVKNWLMSFPSPRAKEGRMFHKTLAWSGEKSDTSIQENARNARYELLLQACVEDGVSVLFVAHHADDQAETILHRLAKGSGIDGLGGMKTISTLSSITILRPLLRTTHDELVHYCKTNTINWIEDPSNENEKFARVRLRKSRDVLAEEGLTAERLVKLGERMQQAADALDYYTEQAFHAHVNHDENAAKGVTLSPTCLELPREIIIRLIIKAAGILGNEESLRGNLKRLEKFCDSDYNTKRQRITLANLILTIDLKKGITIMRE